MIKAIIFDMDGTLVDTGIIGFEVFENTLKKHNLNYTEEEVKSIANRSFLLVLKEIFARNKKQYSDDVLLNMKKEYNARIAKAKLLPYAIELLDAIHDKVIMVLATFSLRDQVDIILNNTPLEKYFDLIMTADSKPYNEKSEQIKDIITTLKLKPDECIHVEDSHYGIKSGQLNGVFTIGVKHYFDDIEADIEVEDLDAAKTIILEKLSERE